MKTDSNDKQTTGESGVASSDMLEPVGVFLIDGAEYWCARSELEAIDAYKRSYRHRITDNFTSEPANDHAYSSEDHEGVNQTMAEAAKIKIYSGKKVPFLVGVSFDVL